MLYLNFALELMALYSTWPARLLGLRVLLIYNILFDMLSIPAKLFSVGHLYWYFYWFGHTVLFFILLATAIMQVPCVLGKTFCTMRRTVNVVMFVAMLGAIARTWTGVLSTRSMLELNSAAAIICSIMAALTLFNRKLSVIVIGFLLWSILAVMLSQRAQWFHYYPLACTAPLAVWSAFGFFIQRRSGNYVTSIPERRRPGIKGTVDTGRDRTESFHRTVRAGL